MRIFKLLLCFCAVTISLNSSAAKLGDVNLDGQVTSVDVAEIVNHLAGLSNTYDCDVTGDGQVSAADIAVVVNILAGLDPGISKPRAVVGGDISLLPSYEAAGAIYRDVNNKKITGDLLNYLKEQGWTAIRLRLFVDPSKAPSTEIGEGVCQDLDYILPLAVRIKQAGLKFMLDFHYSDSWADPVKQYTPDAWVGLSDEELTVKIGEYTTEVLQALNEAGATPDYIQTGNEISYGMCWGKRGSSASSLLKVYPWDDANWPRFRNLLNSAIAACRTECLNAKIIIHSERTTKPNDLVQYYTRLYGMDYDIVGLSYYPRFHGPLSVLKTAIDRLTANVATSKKEIMIVETGWYHAYKPNDVPAAVTYADTESGQQQFTQDLVALLRNYDNVTGLFWWWPEANEYNVNWQNPVTKNGWYNAGLWDNNNGRAMKAIADLQELTKPVVDGE